MWFHFYFAFLKIPLEIFFPFQSVVAAKENYLNIDKDMQVKKFIPVKKLKTLANYFFRKSFLAIINNNKNLISHPSFEGTCI